MRFIRKGGRIIPIRESGAAASEKKKYPAVKKLGVGKGAAFGGATAAGIYAVNHASALAVHGKTVGKFSSALASVAVGAALGAIAGSFSKTKMASGESNKHVMKRISNFSNSETTKKKK